MEHRIKVTFDKCIHGVSWSDLNAGLSIVNNEQNAVKNNKKI